MDINNIPKEYFELIKDDELFLDKPLKTKQLSYFQDAMIRFARNKYNLIASVILLIMILLSIFVPMATPEELYSETNSALINLPPRIPGIEKLGMLDGVIKLKGQPIDITTIDPETEIGTPLGYDAEYIIEGSLENSFIEGTERSELFVGGYNELIINADRNAFSIMMREPVVLDNADLITFEVEKISPNAVFEIYFLDQNTPINSVSSWDDFEYIGAIDGAGVQSVDVSEIITESLTGKLLFKLSLDNPSQYGSDSIMLKSITIDKQNDEDSIVFEGYELSAFELFGMDGSTENGRYLRSGAFMQVAAFEYNAYRALFSDSNQIIGKKEYLEILKNNEGMEESIVLDSEDPENKWTFGSGYPLSGVAELERANLPGVGEYTNYHVMMSGTYELGYDEVPYFFCGTDTFGRDLFSLIWLGLRTSLLLGFTASLANVFLGIIWGSISGYYGGQIDMLMERFTDIWGSFPQITMIGIISVLIGPGFLALFVFLIYDGWISVSKITRMQFYRYKGRQYILAARTLGASNRRIIFKHILPNALGTIVTRVILSIPSVIFLELNLSYLGFGIGNGQTLNLAGLKLTGASIGVILADGRTQILSGRVWMIIFPTLVVALLMITFNMFGNALRDALNPQLRGNE